MRAKWLKKDTNHHKHNHSYEFYVKAPSGVRGDYCYLVHTTYDYTLGEEVDFNDHFSSEISLKQSFKIDKFCFARSKLTPKRLGIIEHFSNSKSFSKIALSARFSSKNL